MAVAFDAVGSSTGFTSTTTSLSWTHTAGTGGGTVLVGVAWGSTSFPPTVTAATYGGNAMTALPSGGQASGGAGSNGGILLYGITGQASGANTVSFTFSGAATNIAIGNSISFTGATGFGTPVKNSGSSASATVTVSGTSASSVVCGVECHGTNGTVTWTAGTKQFDDEVSAASGASNLSGGTVAGGGTGTLTATIPNDVWGFIGVEVQAGGGGGTAAPPVQARPGKTWRRKFSHRQTLPFSPPPNITVNAGLAAGTGAALQPSLSDYIAGMAGTGTAGYFTDQNAQPKFMLLEQAWALPSNAGRWNSGNWQSDIDTYMSTRASQGYTAWFGIAWSDNHVDSTALSGGRTWDGIYPITVNGTPGKITTGSETITLNNSFWTRIDYLFNSALRNGIACFLNLGMQYDFTGSPNIWFNLSTTQANTFGQLIAARYPQSTYPNVFWFFGDDGSGGQDTFFTQMMSGLATGGDTRPLVSTEQLPETNSHIEFDTGAVYISGGFGMSSSVTYNWTYTYDPTYLGVEKGYTESGTTLLPVVYGDGIWYGDNSVSQNVTDYTARRVTWWALASGVRGTNVTCGPTTGGDVWQWQANAVTDLTTDPNGTWITGHIGNVIAYYTSLVNWHKLIPDTGNVLVTAGRGTKSTNDAPGFNTPKYGDTDNYVAASRVSDGSLAVIYSGQHYSITIDQTKMATGYTATWVDPWSLATTSATTGTTYNSTPLGNNSQGNPDWVLVLQGPATTTANAGLATGTSAAQQPMVAITAFAGLATGTGTSQPPVAMVTAKAGLAAGTGTAQPPAIAITTMAGLATGTGTAQPPIPGITTMAGLATGAGAALAPVPAITVFAGLATGTGAALQPTVSTSSGTTANAQLAAGTGAAQPPAVAITTITRLAEATAAAVPPVMNAGIHRLMDGQAGRPGSGPANAISYTGNFIAGTSFWVAQSGQWLAGYWYWVAGGSPAGPTAPQKFALWQVNGTASAALVSGSVVTSGTLTAGWNYVPLTIPVQLTVGSANGGTYVAATGVNGNFNDTFSQFGTGDPYNGLTNGPLVAGSAANQPPYSHQSGLFSTAGTDPSLVCPLTQDSSGDGWSNFWVDVQVTGSIPANYAGSYRLWPGRTDSNIHTVPDLAVNYVIATEVRLTQPCNLNNIWYFSPSGTAQLATRASVYSITDAGHGTEAAAITSPSWSAAAGSGWVSASFPAGTTLNPGSYKVAVFNSAATPDQWSAKEANTDYFQSGEAANGITWGPLTAPALPAASPAYLYDAAGSGNSPAYTDGTGTTAPGQPTFAVGGPQYPYIYAPVGPGTNQTQVYWVDLEVTPLGPGIAASAGTAQQPSVTITASAGLATGTGAAQQAATAVTANAGLAAATGTALQPAVQTSGTTTATAGLPAGAGTAQQLSVTITAPATLATAAGTALAPVPQVTATAGLATATSTALQPAVQTSGNTTANAGLAAAPGTAQSPTATITAFAQLATGTGTAQAGQRIIPATLATAAGTAQPPALTVLARAQATAALAAALNGTIPAQHVPATSTASVTDPRDGTASVTDLATSTSSVT